MRAYMRVFVHACARTCVCTGGRARAVKLKPEHGELKRTNTLKTAVRTYTKYTKLCKTSLLFIFLVKMEIHLLVYSM